MKAQTLFSPGDIERFVSTARNVNIVIDNYGVPHIYGKSDADAVFGLMYVQCKQNFQRVERNYLEVMGRLAEAEGENFLVSDLQMQMIYDSSAARDDYNKSPAWLKKLLHAFADGVNYFLYLNPSVQPKVLKKFEPWFPLMYTDGSISATQTGGLTLNDTRNLYFNNGTGHGSFLNEHGARIQQVTGSNGFAISPSKTSSGNAILYINPHVTFYYRTEVHMVSDEGLNVYGAATWGNFFIYQGFNETCGWMHTSSYADVADLYEEEVSVNRQTYLYNGRQKKLTEKNLIIRYRKEGALKELPVKVYYTHHGPVMGMRSGKWLSLKERNRSLEALEQSWLRTKANSFAEFSRTMDLRSNNSNNTVYADREKNIAYWHGNFIPVRDTSYNWALPVNGTTAATEWKGVHEVRDIVHLLNPASGWIQNANSTPFNAAGLSSPARKNYPEYMAPEGENARGLNAVRLLTDAKDLDIDRIISIGYNRYLPAFEILLPSLFRAFDSLKSDPVWIELQEMISVLKEWDGVSDHASIATTLAIEWGELMLTKLLPAVSDRQSTNMVARFQWLSTTIPAAEKLGLLKQTKQKLESIYGRWRLAWGDANRYQRNAFSTNNNFSDEEWSLPVALASGTWGSLPSYNSRRYPGTKLRYGYSGNSFVAAVEFGERVRAKTIITGGAFFDPDSFHFTDQADGFLEGRFKEIHFYRADVMKHAQKVFQPGTEGDYKL